MDDVFTTSSFNTDVVAAIPKHNPLLCDETPSPTFTDMAPIQSSDGDMHMESNE